MNIKELLLDFLKFHYKGNPLRRQTTNERDVEDYLRQQNLQQCNVKRSCPHCGSTDVIMFTADEDWCRSCDKLLPGA